jgi:hypothetical protein
MAGASRRGCLGVPFAIWLPVPYLAFAVYAWVDFANTNHDGLANVGLFLVTAPVTLVALLVGPAFGAKGMPMPDGHGYLGDHALYYVPAVLVTAALLWLAGRALDRAISR